ncbi:MAG: DUF6913 domain-containing protein [Bacteroidales bacterium]
MKRYILRQRIQQLLKNKREKADFLDFDKVKTVQLLYQSSDSEPVMRFKAALESEGKSVQLIELSEKENARASQIVISPKSFSFMGELNEKQRNQIESDRADLLIDLIPRLRYREIAVVLLSNAIFKVGIHKENYPIYDFDLLLDEKMDSDALIDKIKFYIRIIKAK